MLPSKSLFWLGLAILGMILLAFTTSISPSPLDYQVPILAEWSFLENQHLYLFVNIAAVFFPFVLSFDKKVAFFRQWKALFSAIAIVGVAFIAWDILYTDLGVWGFNAAYYDERFKVFNLPLPEILFFVSIPYCCVFIYECIRCYFPRLQNHFLGRLISLVLAIVLLLFSIFYYEKAYTSLTAFLCAIYLLYNVFTLRFQYLFRFWVSFTIALIPFLLVDGILTGGYTQAPIVLYNPSEFSGIRITSIPLEDFFYGLLLLLLNVNLFEYFRNKK